jgi:hypothetical protein
MLLLVAPTCARGSKPRFCRVDDNVYRGKQPMNMGVKTVLELRERCERKLWERGAAEAAGMQYIRIGLPGTPEPTDHAIDKILAFAGDGAVNFGINMASNAVLNMVREFLPGVTRHVFHHDRR